MADMSTERSQDGSTYTRLSGPFTHLDPSLRWYEPATSEALGPSGQRELMPFGLDAEELGGGEKL